MQISLDKPALAALKDLTGAITDLAMVIADFRDVLKASTPPTPPQLGATKETAP